MPVEATAIANGRYFIVNNVTTPYGALSITHEGEGNPLTLSLYGTECGSVWNVTHYDDGTHKLSPYMIPDLEIVDVGGVLTTINSSIPQGWAIDRTEGLYTIQDSMHTVYWEVQEAKPGEEVTIARSSGEGLNGWWMLPGVGCG